VEEMDKSNIPGDSIHMGVTKPTLSTVKTQDAMADTRNTTC
jgi:hypothetical protein